MENGFSVYHISLGDLTPVTCKMR